MGWGGVHNKNATIPFFLFFAVGAVPVYPQEPLSFFIRGSRFPRAGKCSTVYYDLSGKHNSTERSGND